MSEREELCDCARCRKERFEVAKLRDAADEECCELDGACDNALWPALEAMERLVEMAVVSRPKLKRSRKFAKLVKRVDRFVTLNHMRCDAIERWSDLSEMLGDRPVRPGEDIKLPAQNAPTTIRTQ